uniref:Uncharacterized protein n=1 Tax=Ciona intestinalis TaxID=7719 RepID=H2Y1C8_CIOIN
MFFIYASYIICYCFHFIKICSKNKTSNLSLMLLLLLLKIKSFLFEQHGNNKNHESRRSNP